MTDQATLTWALVAVRCASALVVLAAVTGALPRWLAVVLGAGIAALVAAAMPTTPWPVDLRDAALVSVVIGELAIGAALGLGAALPLLALGWAGRLVDDVLGLPPGDRSGRQWLTLLGTAVFVGIDGPVLLAQALARSYLARPLAVGWTAGAGVVAGVGGLATAAVQLALPLLLCAVIVELAVGAAARTSGAIGPALGVTMVRPVVLTGALALGAVAIAVALAGALRTAWG